MFWFLLGAALALPPAILGSNGPIWVGTLPPTEGRGLVAVVNPHTGDLVLEATERDGRLRRWAKGEWTLDGLSLDPEKPSLGHRMNGAVLVSAVTNLGARHQFQYDEDGRLSAVLWANGAHMRVGYDRDGRVREVNGPGTQRVSLKWANGLRWTDGLGQAHQLRTSIAGPVKKVSLTDPVGRVVLSHYRKRDGEWEMSGWTDPRGLETRIGRYGGRLEVTAPGGRVYRVEVARDGLVAAVNMPAGHRWRWERGVDGLVSRMFDPAGRVTRLERDDAGRVVLVAPSGRVKRLVRDGKGRVVAIHSATGAVTQLVRGDDGHIRSLIDALGNTIFIDRFASGWPSAVLGRTGGRWTMGTDTLGLIDRIQGPMGQVTQLHRNGAGWVERIEDSVFGTVVLGHDIEGRLETVVDAEGRLTRFSRDASGWLKSITRPDGATLHLARNPVGEVISLRFGEQVWNIERAPDGQPRSMGERRWEYDINGRVRTMSGPLGSLRFSRDPAGWIREVAGGEWSLAISRDANGWPVAWSGTDGEIVVTRDAAGRIVTESGEIDTRVLRDPRGAPVRIVAGKLGEWRFQRDGTGRLLRAKGPGGTWVSVERDVLGRPKWFRFPDGSMLRRAYEGRGVEDVLVDPSGELKTERVFSKNGDGAVVEWGTADALWHVESGLSGDVRAIRGGAGQAWIYEPGQMLAPDGRLQLFDAAGWLIEAQVSSAVAGWGVASSLLSMRRDAQGKLDTVAGDSGTYPLTFDGLGRLVSYGGPDALVRGVRYDARGRPAALSAGEQQSERLVWSPDADPSEGLAGLLATGVEGSRPWVFVEGGMASRLNGMEVESLVGDGRGDPSWLLDGAGGAARLVHGPSGMPGQFGTGVAGAGGRLQWFEGGPIQVGTCVVDPLSGQRVDGVESWPWVGSGPRVRPRPYPSDPGPWRPVSSWGDPLRVLELMGVIAPIMADGWSLIDVQPSAHFSIPPSLDTANPPLGPDREALPLGPEDPLTQLLIAAVLPGGEAISPLGPAAALVGAEITLPWLPPGWEVPGLELWREAGAWDQD